MGIGAVLGVGSSLIGASSAKSAQKSQERAAANQLALQERVYEETTERFEPYAESGLDFQNALRFELLGGERPTFGATTPEVLEEEYWTTARNQIGEHDRTMEPIYEHPSERRTRYKVGDRTYDSRDMAQQYADSQTTGGTEYGGYEMSEGRRFRLNEGLNAIDNSAASSGGLFSGATLKAIQGYGEGMAAQGYENYLNRLTAGAAGGQAAAANQANAGANFAAGGASAYANMGNAGAAGAIGVGNALQNGLSNGLGLWNYQKQQTATKPNTSIWGNGGLW